MNEPAKDFVVAAGWLLPIESPPISKGFLVISHGKIKFMGRELPREFGTVPRVDLAGYAILPGLINSHCHLEFSDLPEPISAGQSFPDWIRSLLEYRRRQLVAPDQIENARGMAIELGVQESYEAGVRWVVDMTTPPWSPAWIARAVSKISASLPSGVSPDAPITIQPCLEVLDIARARFQQLQSFVEKQVVAPTCTGVSRVGFAPHAPYTTSKNVTRWLAEQSSQQNRLLTMHLAESVDELEWLADGRGNFEPLLSPNISDDYFATLGQVSEHLQLMSSSWRATIAHGNFLQTSDLVRLSSLSKTMGIVHCPRTHKHFGHAHASGRTYPLADRIAMGVRHFLGTDSRASNPDLNLWRESQFVRAEHPSVESLQILKMITTDAAEFLGIRPEFGGIRVGQPSALTAVKIHSASSDASIYDDVLSLETVSAPLERILQKFGYGEQA